MDPLDKIIDDCQTETLTLASGGIIRVKAPAFGSGDTCSIVIEMPKRQKRVTEFDRRRPGIRGISARRIRLCQSCHHYAVPRGLRWCVTCSKKKGLKVNTRKRSKKRR